MDKSHFFVCDDFVKCIPPTHSNSNDDVILSSRLTTKYLAYYVMLSVTVKYLHHLKHGYTIYDLAITNYKLLVRLFSLTIIKSFSVS